MFTFIDAYSYEGIGKGKKVEKGKFLKGKLEYLMKNLILLFHGYFWGKGEE